MPKTHIESKTPTCVYAAVLATSHFDARYLFKLPNFVLQYTWWHEVCALSSLYYPKMINDTYGGGGGGGGTKTLL